MPETRSSLPVLAGAHGFATVYGPLLVQSSKCAPERAVAAGLLEIFEILIAPSCC